MDRAPENSQKRWAGLALVALTALVPLAAPGVHAQTLTGRVVDSGTGDPVGLTAIIVLDAERSPLVLSAADAEGRYRVDLPEPGSFYLVAERLGYFESESPLLAVESAGEYAVDLEMRPEPIRLDPLQVTVRNEELEDYLSLELGVNPATLRGYRSIQGLRLEEAKLEAEDNTDLLRRLYIPVSHGQRVCVGAFRRGAGLPARMSYERVNARAEETGDRAEPGQCGALYLNGYRCRNEQLEEIDMDRIAVVVATEGTVRLYTRDFDFTFRRSGQTAAC